MSEVARACQPVLLLQQDGIGPQHPGKVDGMLAPFGFTDNVEIALSAEAHSQTAAHLRHIVDEHDADRAHRSDLNDQYVHDAHLWQSQETDFASTFWQRPV